MDAEAFAVLAFLSRAGLANRFTRFCLRYHARNRLPIADFKMNSA